MLYVLWAFRSHLLNSGEGLLGSIIEPLIGYLLDISKIGKIFTLANYQMELFILPSLILRSIKRKEEAVVECRGWKKHHA